MIILANYTPGALQKAVTSIPRVLPLNGDRVASIMVEHSLGLKPSSLNAQKLDIDSDYFSSFDAMRNLFASRVRETPQSYNTNTTATSSDIPFSKQTIDLSAGEDLISAKN